MKPTGRRAGADVRQSIARGFYRNRAYTKLALQMTAKIAALSNAATRISTSDIPSMSCAMLPATTAVGPAARNAHSRTVDFSTMLTSMP